MERGRQRNSARPGDRFEIELETEPGGAAQPGKIGAQAVAEVHHRRGHAIFREPLALRQARRKIQMMARSRTPERSRDENKVARPPAGTKNRRVAFAQQRDVQEKLPGAGRLAADEVDVIFPRASAILPAEVPA